MRTLSSKTKDLGRVSRVRGCRVIRMRAILSAHRGRLWIPPQKTFPFRIARFFYVGDVPRRDVVRGGHAHKKLKQVLFCVKGSFQLELFDGRRRVRVELNRPDRGVLIGPRVWISMCSFSRDGLILVLASHSFNEKEYIRSPAAFLTGLRRDA